MSLTITRVGFRNFRNIAEGVLEPSRGLTVLVGPNAAGKTNRIEAIRLLTCGTTFRHVSGTCDLVRQGVPSAHVEMRVEGDKRVVDVACDLEGGRRHVSVNGKRRRASATSSVLPSVLFHPDDLLVVKGAASGRRDILDSLGSQLNETYGRLVRDFSRALSQRNALLREELWSGETFEAWTDSLVRAGALLSLYRRGLLRRLSPHVVSSYASVASGEAVGVSYESDYLPEGESRADAEQALRDLLSERGDEERARRTTLAGPHRDDVALSVEGRPARLFASQGQQRTLVLAMKLAQVGLVFEMRGEYPVFLLDDVMSELDATRRSSLLSLIDEGVQTIVTTTNLEYFDAAELARAKVVEVSP